MKYELVYLHAFETGSEARAGINWWIEYHNERRPHSTFDGATPDEVYNGFWKAPVADMKLTMGIHLNYAVGLYRKWGPPLYLLKSIVIKFLPAIWHRR